MTERAIPAGFSLKSVTTEVDGVQYTVEVLQADSLQAILDAYKAEHPDKNAEEIVRDLWNSGNEQGAKQSPKSAVRKAIAEHGKGETVTEGEGEDAVTVRVLPTEVETAIADAQKISKGFIQGAPRGGGGVKHESGLSAKKRQALGDAVSLEFARTGKMPTQARMNEIAKELGIDPDQL